MADKTSTPTADKYEATKQKRETAVERRFWGCYQDCRCGCGMPACACHEGNRKGIQREPSAAEREAGGRRRG